MKPLFIAAVILLVTSLHTRVATAQCRNDTECKGDRVCDNQVCVLPPEVFSEKEATVATPEPTIVLPAVAVVPETPAAAPAAAFTPVPAPPVAQPPVVYGSGRIVRLDLNLSIFNTTRTKWDFDTDQGESFTTVSFGPVPSPRMGFGIGFSRSGHGFFGVRILLGISTGKWRDARDTAADDNEHNLMLDYALLPFLEYTFGSKRVKPFITLEMGLDGTYARSSYDGNGYSDTSIDATNMGVIGLGAGVHIFLASKVSLDLWLMESVGVGQWLESDHWDEGSFSDGRDDKTFIWRTRTEIFLGISGWI